MERNQIIGKPRFENGRLISPKKKTYNKNLRIVKKVRKTPIISGAEAKQLRDELIKSLLEITENDDSDFRKTLVKEIKED